MIKWFSTLLFVTAGLLVSFNIEESKYAFPLFFSGHMILITVFYRDRDYALVTQNLFFAAIDIFGIYRWFFA